MRRERIPERGARGLIMVVFAVAAVAFACLPATALAGGAAGRYAEPNGDGAEPCVFMDPCGIQTAVEGAASGDVWLYGGTYTQTDELTIPSGVNVARYTGPVLIDSTAATAVRVQGGGSKLSNVAITGSGATAALLVSGGSAERISATSTSTTATSGACNLSNGTIRDSVCWAHGSGGVAGNALQVLQPTAGTSSATATNTTAVSDDRHAIFVQGLSGGQATLTARNVIASAPGGIDTDVQAAANGGSATVDLDSSNYATELEVAFSGPATITDPGTLNNLTAEPLFVDAATGDFHEAPGSPTADAGTSGVTLGMFDIDSQARTQGAAVDMGADETEGTPPTASITKGPPKKTKNRDAKLKFTGTDNVTTPDQLVFECQLDAKAFEPCDSPQAYHHLKRGRHTFHVQATDLAGNVSPQAEHSWKIVKP